jgi:hypothetical protein
MFHKFPNEPYEESIQNIQIIQKQIQNIFTNKTIAKQASNVLNTYLTNTFGRSDQSLRLISST